MGLSPAGALGQRWPGGGFCPARCVFVTPGHRQRRRRGAGGAGGEGTPGRLGRASAGGARGCPERVRGPSEPRDPDPGLGRTTCSRRAGKPAPPRGVCGRAEAGEHPIACDCFFAILSQGGRRAGRGSGAGTLGVPLGGTRRVGGLLGVAGRLSGTVSPFRVEQGAPPRHAHGDLTSLAPHKRLPEILVVPRDALQADALPSEPPGKPSISETVRCCFGALKSSSTSSLCLSAEKNSVRGTVIDKR